MKEDRRLSAMSHTSSAQCTEIYWSQKTIVPHKSACQAPGKDVPPVACNLP
jgi:hypothetical protein